MATTDIIFDVKTVDTQLAEMYINTRSELHSIGFTENGSYEYDKFKNKIYIADIDAKPAKIDCTTSHSHTLDKLLTLAKLFEKNANLFCQLEYLVRGIPVDDVKKCDLKLITDNLLYCHKAMRNSEFYNKIYCDRIAFLADTPLAALGILAQSLCYGCVNKNNAITIISTKDTAIICSLFVDLCRQVGFDEVLLKLVSKDADCSKYNILEIEEMSTGCVGIVTGKCDVDSAVDAFLSSTVRYPWRVNKIFVQECALERFKRALAWKSERRGPGSPGGDVSVSCAAAYRCADRVFSLEAAGECGAGVVALEAYRTVRELLALLGALRPLAASLWSSDVAESHEIAHGLSATVVWVNDFADFRGPPGVSQALYSVMDVHFNTQTVEYVSELDTIEKLKKSWLLRSVEEREESLMRLCEKYPSYKNMFDKYDFLDSFVRATENVVVTSTVAPARILQIDLANNSVDITVLTFLIRGGGLLVKSLGADLDPLFQDILKIEDIPIVHEGNSEKQTTYRPAKVLWKPCYKHKVIWTNYGTTFAN